MKKIIQYTLWLSLFGSAASLMIILFEKGINHYAATLSVIVFFALVILSLEKRMPFEKDWVKSKGDINLDTAYYSINYGIKLTGQFVIAYLLAQYSFLKWFPVDLPFAVQVFLALIIIDFFLFLVHWQSHKYEFLWKLHSIHHSSERLYWMNGEKRHALHQIMEGAPGISVCLFIGTPQPVVVCALGVLAINQMLQHCNIDYRAGWLKKIFSVAELHRWHHRADYKDAQVNYGAWLIIWDRLFGTYYDEPKMYKGVGEIGIAEEKNFPRNYWKQFLYPFSKKVQRQSKTAMMITAFSFASLSALAQTNRDDIIGNWQMQDGSMKINVFKENDKYYGKIYWVKDMAKQYQAGKQLIWNLQYGDNAKEWNNGEIQLPGMSHAVSCFIKIKDAQTIIVTGYHGSRLFGKSKTLIRIN